MELIQPRAQLIEMGRPSGTGETGERDIAPAMNPSEGEPPRADRDGKSPAAIVER